MPETEVTEPEQIEGEARRMGWVPEDEFKGDPEKWVSAEQFVERGKNELPILRERLKKLDSTIASQEKAISEMNKTFGAFQKYHTDVAKRAYDKALRDIQAEQKKAVKEGDVEGFDRLEKAKEDLKLDTPEFEVPDEKATEKAEFDQWIKDGNEWFEKEPELRNYAASIAGYYETAKGMRGTELYDAVKKDVMARFPDKFENPNRNKPGSVEGGGEPPVKGKKKSYSNLPDEAKKACDKFCKTIPGFTKEQYVKEYDWE